MDSAAIDRITDRVLASLAQDVVTAPAVAFLLRRYRDTDRPDVREALGVALDVALAQALEQCTAASSVDERADWLATLVDADSITDDERLRLVAADLASALEHEWGRAVKVETLMRSIDACLIAIRVFEPRTLVQKALDELERVVGAVYRPSEGMADLTAGLPARGRLADQVRSASALLTAYSLTGRLPYSMLAEELAQFSLRTLWDAERGGFYEDVARLAKPFALNCEATRVLCRLAALHLDDDYRHVGIIAPDANYARVAGRILESQSAHLDEPGCDPALFGLALDEWLHMP
jgi:hypothetical protein